jgi:predicted anti-sigma-YlaC factor YlaD
MLTCKEMSELGSKIIDDELTARPRMAVLMHLSMCSRCRRYIKQLRLTSQVLQQLPPDSEPVDSAAILEKVRK